MDGFDFPFLPPLVPVDEYVELFKTSKGFVLPHIETMQQIYYGTSGTRAHLGNPEAIKRLTGRIESTNAYDVDMNMELWQRCSNLTLWVMNGLVSLATLVTKPANFLYDPARNLKRVAYLGTSPEKCMTGAKITITHDDGTTSENFGTIPCGLFLALMCMYTMASTPCSSTTIWGRTEPQIKTKLQQYAINNCINIEVSASLEPCIGMLSMTKLVLLSKRVRNFALAISEMVHSPEALTETTKVASKCPSCSRKVSTATPRHMLSPAHEEYDPEDTDLIGDQKLLRVKIATGDFEVYRHIYVCSACNDEDRPLRFNHLSISPSKSSKKRKPTSVVHINTDTAKVLDMVDFLAENYLHDSKRRKLLKRSKKIRDKIA